MSVNNPYITLEVNHNSSANDIKRNYKRLAMRYHPDRNNSPDAETRFKDIQQAYAILSDPTKKHSYDTYGTTDTAHFGGEQGFNDFSTNFSSIFDDFFSNRQTFSQSSSSDGGHTGRNLQIQIELDLEDAVHGCTRKIKINSFVNCTDCNGNGAKTPSDITTCRHCHGSGAVQRRIAIMVMRETCPHCSGSGKSITKPCNTCDGNGRVREKRTVTIKIPAGVDNDDVLRIAGKGEAGKFGGASGDILASIVVRKHPVFIRSGDNLTCDMPISFTTAALGGEAEVPTLNSKRKVTLVKGLQTGRRVKIQGAGVRGVRSNEHGDLYCTLQVETPQNLSKEQKDLLMRFETSLNKNPKKHSPAHTSWLDRVKNLLAS